MSARGSQPPRAVTDMVDRRDEQRCFRCGVWIESNGSRHHRQRRQVAGHHASVLILTCGSGVTGCHGWCHANPAAARRLGLIVRAVSNIHCRDVPAWSQWRNGWYLLDDEGGLNPLADANALELLAMVA